MACTARARSAWISICRSTHSSRVRFSIRVSSNRVPIQIQMISAKGSIGESIAQKLAKSMPTINFTAAAIGQSIARIARARIPQHDLSLVGGRGAPKSIDAPIAVYNMYEPLWKALRPEAVRKVALETTSEPSMKVGATCALGKRQISARYPHLQPHSVAPSFTRITSLHSSQGFHENAIAHSNRADARVVQVDRH